MGAPKMDTREQKWNIPINRDRPGLDLSVGRFRGGKAKFPENSGSLPLSGIVPEICG